MALNLHQGSLRAGRPAGKALPRARSTARHVAGRPSASSQSFLNQRDGVVTDLVQPEAHPGPAKGAAGAGAAAAAAPTPPGSWQQQRPDDIPWTQLSFPFYSQPAEPGVSRPPLRVTSPAAGIWRAIRAETAADAAQEPLLSSFLYASVLAHGSFPAALAFVLANRLASAVMLPVQLLEAFEEVLETEPGLVDAALADVAACVERDPSCTSYSQALLYSKGFHALQTHRIAHALWNRGRSVLALALQSRASEVLAVDIHPAARFGAGVFLGGGGIVVGATAVVGGGAALLQNCTLGGTGKESGDRHPKVGARALVGANASVLGNIPVGEGAQVAAGSVVLKPVPPHTLVAGSPAKAVGEVHGNPASMLPHDGARLGAAEPRGCSGAAPAGAAAGADPEYHI